ncbi:MAG: protein kinase [Myxococcales bacterium]|nr:protein kinase [Polyangiaceae bacterium]MDW8248917.1 protein kinase [Myxococcales bacterium]
MLPRPGAGGTLPGDDPPPPALLGNLPAAPLPPRNLRPGDVVDNKYRIESVLGEGGMGIVYLALDQNTSMHVVVKAIRGELAHDPDSRERIMAEGRVLAQIDHPNVVRLNAIVIENGIELYLVMQYIEGQSLDRLIERHVQARQPLPFPEALGIFRQVIMGVGAAHREGVVHRDIKPGNVLIRAKDGMVKVTDFGIAKTEDDAKAGKGKTRGIIGSLWYMAPEQVTGRRDLDKRVDIYALGILFYEMLVGSVPFDAASDYELMKMHVEAPLPSACTARSDIPPWVDAVLSRACAKDREQRFSSCEELLATLEHLAPEPRAVGRLPTVIPAMPQATTPPQGPLSPPRAPQPSHTSFPAPLPRPSTPEPSQRAPTQDEAPSTAITAQHGMLLPSRPRWPWLLGGLGLLGLSTGVVWLLGFSGLLERSNQQPQARPAASLTASTPLPPASRVVSPRHRLDALQGRWRSETGRVYQATKFADTLEFRIVDASQFPGQDYRVNEPRFVLLESPGNSWFAVEEKLRPQGPTGTVFDPASRGTCLVVLRSLAGEPLRAHHDNNQLRVDLIIITPNLEHFHQRAGRVIGCNRLDTARMTRTQTTLIREGT